MIKLFFLKSKDLQNSPSFYHKNQLFSQKEECRVQSFFNIALNKVLMNLWKNFLEIQHFYLFIFHETANLNQHFSSNYEV